jgi:hypothetical protein
MRGVLVNVGGSRASVASLSITLSGEGFTTGACLRRTTLSTTKREQHVEELDAGRALDLIGHRYRPSQIGLLKLAHRLFGVPEIDPVK